MDIIYLVVGESGDYEDRAKWNVAFYENKRIAEIHSILAAKRAEEIMEKYGKKVNFLDLERFIDFSIIPEKANEYDSEMRILNNHVEYYTTEVKRGSIK